ncbi:MAG: hypothetical protein ACKVQW_06840 [Pyrinomonadaceae bacterium]
MTTILTNGDVLRSVRALLAGSIDYAGLFPPSAVSMADAVINYATYRNSNYSWMLGRFVVTAARLDEFYESAHDFVSRDATSEWHLSVVAGEDIVDTIKRIEQFSASSQGVVVDSVEVRANSTSKIKNTIDLLPDGVNAYFELPLGEELSDLIADVSLAGGRAKVRTGGVTPDAFPTSKDIIRFVRGCLAANVPFKATAGLHHPIRCYRPLTYEENSVQSTMHGFLNLFLMTGMAREGFRQNLLEEVMEEEFSEVFRFEDQSAAWREQYSLNIWQIEALRRKGIQSFGSCSFDEPIADLRQLGIL